MVPDSTKTMMALRVEQVIAAHHRDVWDVISSATSLPLWLANVTDAGEWFSDEFGNPQLVDDATLFDQVSEFRWIRYTTGDRARTAVAQTVAYRRPRHIEWAIIGAMVGDEFVERSPERGSKFRIEVEPAAGDSRVRLTLWRAAPTGLRRLTASGKRKRTLASLQESLTKLDDYFRYA